MEVGELRFIKPAVPDELDASSSGAFRVQGELYSYRGQYTQLQLALVDWLPGCYGLQAVTECGSCYGLCAGNFQTNL